MKKLNIAGVFVVLVFFVCQSLSCGKQLISNTKNNHDKNPKTTPLLINHSAKTNSDASPKASDDLRFLKKWIGKYPFNKSDKEYSDFFQVPQVKKLLVEIIGEYGFQNLLSHFVNTEPIAENKGFIYILGTSELEDGLSFNHGLIAIKLETGETHAYFVDDEKLKGFSNTEGNGTLPIEIKELILPYTGQAEIVGTIKQKAGDSYTCYAVKYDDWDAHWDKRPYIFRLTDEGGKQADRGIMNINGKDILLENIKNKETKGESGQIFVKWVYENNEVRATFDMHISEIPDSSAVIYDGKVIVSTYTKMQTIDIRAFCGG